MPERSKRARNNSRTVLIASIANIVLTAVAMVIFLWQNSEARKDNCTVVSQALDAYTEGLVAATALDDTEPPTAEEQAAQERAIEVLQSTYRDILAEDCR